MHTKFIAAVAVAVSVAFTIPAMAGVKCAVTRTSHAACTTAPPHGAMAGSSQGATVSHGGAAVTTKPH